MVRSRIKQDLLERSQGCRQICLLMRVRQTVRLSCSIRPHRQNNGTRWEPLPLPDLPLPLRCLPNFPLPSLAFPPTSRTAPTCMAATPEEPHAVKLWKKSTPRSQSLDHFACGLRMNRGIAVKQLPMRASHSSFSCLQASRRRWLLSFTMPQAL